MIIFHLDMSFESKATEETFAAGVCYWTHLLAKSYNPVQLVGHELAGMNGHHVLSATAGVGPGSITVIAGPLAQQTMFSVLVLLPIFEGSKSPVALSAASECAYIRLEILSYMFTGGCQSIESCFAD
jgi:hypothetical protein